ncbi:MAG: STAS domain-containing protein [Planctomycetota bacterium]
MTIQSSSGAGFRACSTADGAARKFELRDRCLNYDVSDGLKAGVRQAVADDLEEGHRTFLFDLGRVEEVDSSGVGILIAVHHQVVAEGGTVAFIGCCPQVTKVLQMMRLDKFLALFPDEEKALRALVERC